MNHGPHPSVEQQWRTTRTHTVTEMMSVYKEIFFAIPHRTSVGLPQVFFENLFSSYGQVEAFQFDDRRGVGFVFFKNGTDAESCYLATNFLVLCQPEERRSRRGASTHDPFELDDLCLLHVEFAQYLPFANPSLFDERVTVRQTCSRLFMRTMPLATSSSPRGELKGTLLEVTRNCVDYSCDFARCLHRETVSMLDLWHHYFLMFVNSPLHRSHCGVTLDTCLSSLNSGTIQPMPSRDPITTANTELRSCLFNRMRREATAVDFRLTLNFIAYRIQLRDETSMLHLYDALKCQLNAPLRAESDNTTAMHDIIETTREGRNAASRLQDLSLPLMAHFALQRAGGAEAVGRLLDDVACTGSRESLWQVVAPVDGTETPSWLAVLSLLWRTLRLPLSAMAVLLIMTLFLSR